MAKCHADEQYLAELTRNYIVNDLHKRGYLINQEHFNMIRWLIHHRVFNIDMSVYWELLQDVIELAAAPVSPASLEKANKAFLRLTKFLSLDEVCSFFNLFFPKKIIFLLLKVKQNSYCPAICDPPIMADTQLSQFSTEQNTTETPSNGNSALLPMAEKENVMKNDKLIKQFLRAVKAHKLQKFKPFDSIWSRRFRYFTRQAHYNRIEENWLDWMGYI